MKVGYSSDVSSSGSEWPEYADNSADVFAEVFQEQLGQPVPLATMKAAKAAFVQACDETGADGKQQDRAEIIVQLLRQFRSFDNCPELSYFAALYLAAFGLSDLPEDKTFTSIAKEFGVTRAAISKRIKDIRAAANPLQTCRHQKSLASRKVYSLRQLIVGASISRPNLTKSQKETEELWRYKTREH